MRQSVTAFHFLLVLALGLLALFAKRVFDGTVLGVGTTQAAIGVNGGGAASQDSFEIYLPTVQNVRAHGQWIAFIGEDGNVHLVSSDDATRRVQVTDDDADHFWLRWAPDGRKLGYIRRGLDPVGESIQIYDLTTGSVDTLVTASSIKGFDWSPDSNAIVYAPLAGGTAISGLNLVDINSHGISGLVAPQGGKSLVWPDWSPDGRFLVFEEAFIEGPGEVVVYDVINHVYPAPYERLGHISWAPDGSSLAYDSAGYLGFGVSISLKEPAFLGESIALTPAGTGYRDSTPEFSPDGNVIAFVRVPAYMDPMNPSGPLWVVDPDPYDGVAASLLTEEDFSPGSVSWSPDGDRIAASLRYCGIICSEYLYVIDTSPVTVHYLTPGMWPEWQP